ncbi:hypothetical protein [Gloeocapsa sp. PCC 73106]|uniref:hypothetical protein n=1 Tax=Gloeocapsa sp. PCC 73106 TaxID=102232 RepID=UPI0002ABB4CE|nr:hypothetical protein [Gloeocapsa sp. PCC 73106]ELS00292.1 hypothetical protein GLO73106DRAFT_00041500 [Gloeocapsa sp. PCC 73106]
MNDELPKLLSEKINQGVHKAIAEAIEKHRKLGQSVAIWQDNQVVILPPEKIPNLETKTNESRTITSNINKI